MKKLVKKTMGRLISIEANKTSMLQAIAELKHAQESVFKAIFGINERLKAVESQSATFDSWKLYAEDTRQVLQRMAKDN